MPKIIGLDTTVLVRGILEIPSSKSEESDQIPNCIAFLKELQRLRVRIMIPSVVFGEVLCSVRPENMREMMTKLHKVFIVQPYDVKAAERAVVIYQDMMKEFKAGNFPDMRRCEIRPDSQIIATALVNNISGMYSYDKDFCKIASKYITALPVPSKEDIPQLLLPFSEPENTTDFNELIDAEGEDEDEPDL